MGQLAVLHTVYDVLSKQDQPDVRQIFTSYQSFLLRNETNFYEYLKTNQPNTLEVLDRMKTPDRQQVPAKLISQDVEGLEEHRVAFVENAKCALAALFKAEAFSEHKNGFTYQALSVFVENASIGGCKSANERAQAVNGRVAILDFVSLDKKTRDNLLDTYLSKGKASELKTAVAELETAIEKRDLTNITKNLNTLYGSLNLEGFQALISFIDSRRSL